jgi:8-oxo-dGTP pyrophosphatase MutT (NUDIX family)
VDEGGGDGGGSATGLAADAARRSGAATSLTSLPPVAAVKSGPGTVCAVETLRSSQVYVNRWMTVREDAVRRPDGSEGVYGVVDKPTYALVIPRDGDRLHLVEQYRYPVGRRRWEFPAGTAPDRAEVDTAELAARELQEETGLVAGRMELIGHLDVAPGMSSQTGTVWLATALRPGPAQREHTEQDMRAGWFTVAQFEEMARDGTITDSQSLAAYLLLQLHDARGPAGRSGRGVAADGAAG